MPRGLGNAGLLLGLVLDGDRWPDAPTFTAGRLGCSDDTVRRHACELVRLGLVERRDGFLVATAAGRDRLRRCDPLPRVLLRPGVAGRTLAVLRAAAVLYGETLGMRATRHGVRGDRERADLAGVHRETVPKARALLASVGVATFAEVRRGRARLVRAAAVADSAGRPVGSHGRPLGAGARERIAATAAKRRATAAETGRVTTAGTGQPMQVPSGPSPMQAPVAPAADGGGSLRAADGCPEGRQAEPAGVVVRVADAQQRRRSAPAAVADVVAELVPDLAAAEASRADRAAGSCARAAAELQRLAADPQTVTRLLRMPGPRAIADVLAAAQVYDLAPAKRDGLAVQVGRVLDPLRVFVLALDVVLGRPRNVGRVVLERLQRALRGDADLLTRCRAAWPIGQFLAAVGGSSTDVPVPAPAGPTTQRAAAPVGTPGPGAAAPTFVEFLQRAGLGALAARRVS